MAPSLMLRTAALCLVVYSFESELEESIGNETWACLGSLVASTYFVRSPLVFLSLPVSKM